LTQYARLGFFLVKLSRYHLINEGRLVKESELTPQEKKKLGIKKEGEDIEKSTLASDLAAQGREKKESEEGIAISENVVVKSVVAERKGKEIAAQIGKVDIDDERNFWLVDNDWLHSPKMLSTLFLELFP
jgi:hypothetical protein